jgi:polyisoprenoid-binding protein YceI
MKSLITIVLSVAVVCSAISTTQAVELTQVVAEKSQITFTSKQMGVPVNGGFSKFDAQITIDPAKPETGKAQVQVDLGSIDAGSSDATTEARGKDWLNIVTFPKASFVASTVKLISPGRYEARGALSIKGISRDTVVPFSIRNEGQGSWLEGGFVFPRLQFKIGSGAWGDTSTVADEIQVKFKLFLVPKK